MKTIALVIVLLFILLFWQDRDRTRGGIWLAIGIILKPYVAVLFLYLVIKRHWRGIGLTLITLAALSLLSLIAFGWTTFISYFTSNPTSKLPPWFFTELDKGNLYAMIWRLIEKFLGESFLGLVLPIFIGISLVLTLVTVWLINQLISVHDEWALATVLSLALFLYPNTGTNYYVTLIAPIFLLWNYKEKMPGGGWSLSIFMALEAAFFAYQRGWSNFVFLGMALGWLALFGFGIVLLMQKRIHQHNIS